MISFAYLRHLVLSAVIAGVPFASAVVCAAQKIAANASTSAVTLHWAAQRGVSRYRLQIANDSGFTDIALDRVIYGLDYQVGELPPGKYFWRVAPVGRSFNRSSAGVFEIRSAPLVNNSSPSPVAPSSPTRQESPKPAGWYAALGNVTTTLAAHLRFPNRDDLVAMTSDNRVTALDGATGVELWTVRLTRQSSAAPMIARFPDAHDNVLIFGGAAAALLDGRTGRVVWQSTLSEPAAAAVSIGEKIFVIGNSLRKVSIINSVDGVIVGQADFSRRIIGAPVVFDPTRRSIIVALEDGRVQVIEDSGKIVRDGSAQSPATTAPLYVKNTRGAFVLIGTKDGLTALNAADLRPLGRVDLKGDVPRGTLSLIDIDADRNPEVVMLTERGQVFVLKSDEGKILWSADAYHAESAVFADMNSDGIVDVVVVGKDGLPLALSGRDGRVVWKEEPVAIVANHAPAARFHSLTFASTTAGMLMITSDGGSGVRAIALPAARAN